MKTKLFLLAAGLAALTFVGGCKKKEKADENACNGKNFCMKMNGTLFAEDATWRTINDTHYRILWESSSGTYKNVEIDFYGSIAAGTYTVVASPSTSGQGGFQYYVQGANNIKGQSGTLTITSVANNTLSGNFKVTATDAVAVGSVEITEGHFYNVPKK